jgi:hypothetical protein
MAAANESLGERVVRAAKMAAMLHLRLMENMEFGRNTPVGGEQTLQASAGLVKDGLPSAAIVCGGHSPTSPWIRAGEYPAGSFN